MRERPTDEDVWLAAFAASLSCSDSDLRTSADVADAAVTAFRERYPDSVEESYQARMRDSIAMRWLTQWVSADQRRSYIGSVLDDGKHQLLLTWWPHHPWTDPEKCVEGRGDDLAAAIRHAREQLPPELRSL